MEINLIEKVSMDLRLIFIIAFVPVVLSGCTITVTCPEGYKVNGIICSEILVHSAERNESFKGDNAPLSQSGEAEREAKRLDDIRLEKEKVEEGWRIIAEREKQEAEYKQRQYEKNLAEIFAKEKQEQLESTRKKNEEDIRRKRLEECYSSGLIGLCYSWIDQPMVNVCLNGNPINDWARTIDINSWAYCNIKNNNIIRVNLSARNNTNKVLKDLVVTCHQLAESGTILQSSGRVIYKNFYPGKPVDFTVEFSRVRQISQLRCKIDK